MSKALAAYGIAVLRLCEKWEGTNFGEQEVEIWLTSLLNLLRIEFSKKMNSLDGHYSFLEFNSEPSADAAEVLGADGAQGWKATS